MTCKQETANLPSDDCETGLAGGCGLNMRSPGRPRDMEKREAIIDAAQTLFSERGVEGVSIEAIAAASGVSKVTVYSHFGDKAAIFRSMIQRETHRLARVIAEASPPDGPLEDRLIHFGVPLLAMLSTPCHVSLGRTMAIEATRNPDIGRDFFDAGPGRTLDLLVDLLTDAVSRGELQLDNPRLAAEDLVSLWLGVRMMKRAYLPQTCAQDAAELCAQIVHGTKTFLRAYGPNRH